MATKRFCDLCGVELTSMNAPYGFYYAYNNDKGERLIVRVTLEGVVKKGLFGSTVETKPDFCKSCVRKIVIDGEGLAND